MTNDSAVLLVGQGSLIRALSARLGQQGVRVLRPEAYDADATAAIVADSGGAAAMHRAVLTAEALLPRRAPLLVAALSQSATQAASWCREQERVSGFGLLPPLGDTVEVARALQTDDAAWAEACAVWRSLGFRPEPVQDGAGLVLGRILAALINEAASAWAEGIAGYEEIERAMQLGANYPRGLLAWAEDIGLEQVVAILEGLWQEWREERYRPTPALVRLALAGKGFSQCGKRSS